MAKISVRHCVAQAYGLLFGQPFTLIGLTWLPALFYALATAWLIQRMDMAMAAAVPSGDGILGQYALFYFALLVVATALFGGTIAVSLTRQAFALREERVAAHLVIGARELRLFFALTRYYALTVMTLLVFATAAGIAVSRGTNYASVHGIGLVWLGVSFQTWLNSAAAVAAALSFLFFAVRFGFLLDAVAAVEERTTLSRARALSRGNFWRIAVTLFIVAVPACVLFVACETTFGGLALEPHGYSIAAANAASFAGILAGALVVLHALLAGASASAYAEMAEAVAQENEPADEAVYQLHQHQLHQPAMASAQIEAVHDEPQPGGYAHEVVPEAEARTAAPQPMEIATLEADGTAAAASVPATDVEWMAPPPDAHFGSDPHDALPYDAPLRTVARSPFMGDGENTKTVEPPGEAVTLAEFETAAHPVEVQNASTEAEPPIHNALVDDGAGEPVHASTHSDVADAAAASNGQVQEIPDHAHNAEFPAPQLELQATAMAAQAGFHTPE